ncbi:MAG: hypothetical protein ACE5HV_06545 [Acidobacteriota bacterium]
MEYTLRRLESIDEYRACERMQQEAWGFADALDVIPQSQLVTAQKYGGLALGAFDADDRLRGFCYGFLGRDSRQRLVHCSHMLAVDATARNAGLGARLKWAQRQMALDVGVELMVWTFDPLESLNACFNFDKLGVVSDQYLVNLYGETTSRLHAGTATDRLTVQWFLRSERVMARLGGERGALAAALAAGKVRAPWALRGQWSSGLLRPRDPRLDLEGPRLRCEIPAEIQRLKASDAGASVAWRQATRAVFTHYLNAGFYVRECVRTVGSPPRTVYLLERGSCEPKGLAE